MAYTMRKHSRYPCLGVAEIKTSQDTTMPMIMTSMLYNISPSGLKCSAFEELPEGTSLVVDIYEFMGMNVQAEIEGTVAWSSNTGTMGIQFTKELDQAQYPELCELICSRNSNL